mgnify:CR=1 FL=1
MKLGRVIGNLVSTVKNEAYQGSKILWVQPIDEEGQDRGDAFITLDAIGAGAGEPVLVVEEGGSAQMVMGKEMGTAPIGTAIVAIVDEVRVRS